MPVFTPPTEDTVPALEADTVGLQRRLFRFMTTGTRGRNVYRLVDGTYTEIQPQLLSNPDPANHADDVNAPAFTFYGGHIYNVTLAEGLALAAAGYGAYLVYGVYGDPYGDGY